MNQPLRVTYDKTTIEASLLDWRTREFLEQLRFANSPFEAQAIFEKQITRFGYKDFDYNLVEIKCDGIPDTILELNTLREDWQVFYSSEELQRTDPIVLHCLTHNTPLIWSDVQKRNCTDAQWRTMSLAQDWGYNIGVSVPLPSWGRHAAGLGLIADAAIGVSDHKRMTNEFLQEVVLTAEAFHMFFDKRELAIERYGLSQREIEVLRWLSEGLVIKEVSFKMGTSESTIEKQLRSARRRLEVKTSAQAVLKAGLLGVL